MIKKKVKTSRVAKTRNHFTLSEAAFWSFIRSNLRAASRWWKPISYCKSNARRKYTGKNKLQRWEYQCKKCGGWFKDKEVAVDHIFEAGTLTCKEDLPGFVERLFCEIDGFQVLCNKREDGIKSCHKTKTEEYMKNRKK